MIEQSAKVNAKLLEYRTLHLGHNDADHHLFLTFHREQVDHRLGGIGILIALIVRCGGLALVGRGPARVAKGRGRGRAQRARIGVHELRRDLGCPAGINGGAHRSRQDEGVARNLAANVGTRNKAA